MGRDKGGGRGNLRATPMKTNFCTRLKWFLVAVLFLLVSFAAMGQGTIMWNEGVNGPLSNITNSPSALSPLVGGSNSIIGSITRAGGNLQMDYFTFLVPANIAVQAMWLSSDSAVQVYDGNAGYVNGSTYGILTSGGISGSNVLPPGQHWMAALFNGGIAETVNYRIDFVTTVPEPSAWFLSFVGMAVFYLLRRRKRGYEPR
jgi:hypothetical protein